MEFKFQGANLDSLDGGGEVVDAGGDGRGKENQSDKGAGSSGAANVPGSSRDSGSSSGSESGSGMESAGSASGDDGSGGGSGGDDPDREAGDLIINDEDVDDEDDEEDVGADRDAAEDQEAQVLSSNPGSPVGEQGKNWMTFESLMEETYPAKSKEVYLSAYRDFELFLKSENKFAPNVVPDETMLLNYFRYLKNIKQYKATSIWSQYARLNGVLKRRFRFSLKEFPSVTDLLKSYEVGHRVKKASVFTPQQE
jgi:hypothetical protein